MAGSTEVTVNAKTGDEHADRKAWKATPIETVHPESVDAAAIRLFHAPAWQLRMTIEGDRSYIRIKVVRAAPLSQPDRYICFLDYRDEAICMVDDLHELDEASQKIALAELDRRYLTAYIQDIHAIRNEYGVSYWDVATDRGRREFVAKNVAENAQWLGESRLFVLDVDGNRFEVPDLKALSRKAQALVEQVL